MLRAEQEGPGVGIDLVEGVGDPREVVVRPGILVQGADHGDGEAEQQASPYDAGRQPAGNAPLQLLLEAALLVGALGGRWLHIPCSCSAASSAARTALIIIFRRRYVNCGRQNSSAKASSPKGRRPRRSAGDPGTVCRKKARRSMHSGPSLYIRSQGAAAQPPGTLSSLTCGGS